MTRPDAPAPADLGDGWPVAAPAEAGLDPGILDGLVPQFTAWRAANLHAVLIARHGRLAYERYFTGPDQRWGQDLGAVSYDSGMAHDLRSISKSVTSLLAGIGRQRGWLPGLDTPVLSLLPECADLAGPDNSDLDRGAITIRHLLTMSAGLAWNEDLPYSDPRNSERLMSIAPDRARYVLEQPLLRPPGRVYGYNGGLTLLLGDLLAAGGGAALDDLAQEVLFDPLGIARPDWVRYPDGVPICASGLRLRPRDGLKIGQMVLQGGRWQDRQVVPADWIVESLTPQINGQELYFYGYQWWLGRSLVRKREIGWAAAMGWGGQRLYLVPGLDLVVLVHAGLYDNPPLQPVVGGVVLRRYALEAAVAADAAGT
ncbi:serine hydrolase domain-containing protein [Marinibaculum pumilum]|uniref:Serine hydrolase domain-containing protein n=1 Tax=Marinibaculum pumilum TaxID=1766165 RepID=A0ABV7L688_9PROT